MRDSSRLVDKEGDMKRRDRLSWYCETCKRNHRAETWAKKHDLVIELDDLEPWTTEGQAVMNLFFLLGEGNDAKKKTD